MAFANDRSGFPPRLVASAIDFTLALVLAGVLSRSSGLYFASRAVVTLGIGEAESLWKGTLPMLIGIFGVVIYGLPFAVLLVQLPELFLGFSLGKLAMRIRVRDRGGERAGPRTALLRFLAKTSGCWGLCLAFVLGSWAVAVAAAACLAAIFAGSFLALGPAKLALHDRVAGTAVYRMRGSASRIPNAEGCGSGHDG